MWRSLLLHEITGGDLRNFRAVEGVPTSFPLNADAIGRGEEFAFALDRPLDEIIGFSCHISLRKPIAGFEIFRIARAGTSIEFSIQRVNTPVVEEPELAAPYRGLLRVGQSAPVILGVLTLPHRTYSDIRFDWHTSGQARMLQQGQLVGYHNEVATGASVAIPDLAFGRSDMPPGGGSRYGVARFFVRALTRTDALITLSRLLPAAPSEQDPRVVRCTQLAKANLLGLVDALRPFMSLAHQQMTVPWSADLPGPAGPFSAEAAAAHESALLAGAALVRMLRSMDFDDPQAFLGPFEALLTTLHDALPNEFETLAQSLLSAPQGLPQECLDLFEHDRGARGGSMGPVFHIFEEAATIVERIAGS